MKIKEKLGKVLYQINYFIIRENIHRILFIILALLVTSTVGLVIFEKDVSWTNAFWWSIVTMTTVGYGDITPQTLGGRTIGAITMLLGIGILGMFTATIASVFVERKLKENRGMGSFTLTDHIIICEWNYRAREILRDLRSDSRTATSPIVLIAKIDEKPVEDENLFFINGDVNEENMQRAHLASANTVIILGDDKLDDNARDAQVVLSTLTVEGMNRGAYTIVELVDERNVRHCQRARADEIIVTNEFSSHLISRTALNHGISKVVSELLSAGTGNDFYRIPVPEHLQEKTFIEVFTAMKQEYNSIVLAIYKEQSERVISNPATDYKLVDEDHLILIAHGQPEVTV